MDFIELFPEEMQSDMSALWAGCPSAIKERVRIVKIPQGQNFICAGEPCDKIYIILKGYAWGIDTQVLGKQYKFKSFKPGRFLGEPECFSGIPYYTITVQAETDCLLCVIGASLYLEWMKTDPHALLMRTKETIFIFMQQTQNDRRFFLSPCRERLMQYLVKCYEEHDEDSFLVEKTRGELASAMGFVERTIERNIKKLEMNGLISLQRGKILVSNEQYRKLKEHVGKTVPIY